MSLKYYECPICLETITDQNYYILSECIHKYHITCLTDWYNKQPVALKTFQCPECQLSNTQLIPVEIPRKIPKLDKPPPSYESIFHSNLPKRSYYRPLPERPKKRVVKPCCIQ